MIERVSGRLVAKTAKTGVINLGPISVGVNLSSPHLAKLTIGDEIDLFTRLIVREDALELFGFESAGAQELFDLLTTVSGIGPRGAMAILSLAPPEIITRAIASGDSGYLTSVSGVGKKSAEKIVVELRDKVASLDLGTDQSRADDKDVVEALQALGYSAREAREAVMALPTDIENSNDKIKVALQRLGKGHHV